MTTTPASAKSPVDVVLAKVGKPDDFIKAEARHLYGDHYRVNVWARTAGGPRIVYSEIIRG